jgi:hypothetical protein
MWKEEGLDKAFAETNSRRKKEVKNRQQWQNGV